MRFSSGELPRAEQGLLSTFGISEKAFISAVSCGPPCPACPLTPEGINSGLFHQESVISLGQSDAAGSTVCGVRRAASPDRGRGGVMDGEDGVVGTRSCAGFGGGG